MADDYSDIIDLPHHQSDHRPHMDLLARAAQFSPFAALRGYEDVIEETRQAVENFEEIIHEKDEEYDPTRYD